MKLFTALFRKNGRKGLGKGRLEVGKDIAKGMEALTGTKEVGEIQEVDGTKEVGEMQEVDGAKEVEETQGVVLDYKLAEESHRLFFASRWEVPGGMAVDKADVTYQLGGRTYTGLKTACECTEEEISDGVRIGKDEFGGKVLYQYSTIPTFDSSDRQWDSLAGSFLIFDSTNIDLLRFRRGYCVAKIEVYEKLLAADGEMKPWLDRLGFPAGEIKWG